MAERCSNVAEDSDEPVTPVLPTVRTPTVVWLHDSPVFVTIVDMPVHVPRNGVCCCGSCRAAQLAELAARFL